jgi:hypothetical protein
MRWLLGWHLFDNYSVREAFEYSTRLDLKPLIMSITSENLFTLSIDGFKASDRRNIKIMRVYEDSTKVLANSKRPQLVSTDSRYDCISTFAPKVLKISMNLINKA